jgi:hypothetical protein
VAAPWWVTVLAELMGNFFNGGCEMSIRDSVKFDPVIRHHPDPKAKESRV